jgi:hypothetical protein
VSRHRFDIFWQWANALVGIAIGATSGDPIMAAVVLTTLHGLRFCVAR